MLSALRLLVHAFRHLNHRGYIYVWANVLWFLLTLPIITAPAAWAGLVNLSRQAYLNQNVSLADFWSGFRINLRRGMVMALLNIFIIVINLFNLGTYQNLNDPLTVLLRGTWWLILVLWLAVQFYMWPLLYELKQPSLVGALRNALVMIMLNPLFTLVILIATTLLIALSMLLFPAWILLTGSALAIVSTGSVLDRLTAAGLRQVLPKPELEMEEDDFGGMNIE